MVFLRDWEIRLALGEGHRQLGIFTRTRSIRERYIPYTGSFCFKILGIHFVCCCFAYFLV